MTRPTHHTAIDLDGNQYRVAAAELFWRPSAYGIVIRDGQILLCRHMGKYNLPGGGIEFGETLEEGLRREVREETGVEIARPRLLAAETQVFMPPYTGKAWQSVLLYYACDYAGGELSMEGFQEYEKLYAEMPEWVDLSTIDEWTVTSTLDFRPLVRQAMSL